MNNGWIKIHRKILDWEWYDEPNTFRLFFHLLLKANHKPKNYRGTTIETGEVMTGLNLLSEQTKLSVRQIRTSLSRLKSTNELTIKTSSKGTIIQLVKYKEYQIVTSETTNQRQTNDKPTTTNKNVKKEKNINIPTQNAFLKYAKDNDVNYESKKSGIILKYKAWVQNDWRNGNDKPIKNWKSTLLNTLGYIQKDFKKQNNDRL